MKCGWTLFIFFLNKFFNIYLSIYLSIIIIIIIAVSQVKFMTLQKIQN